METAMSDAIKLHYEISGDDFSNAGEASTATKTVLKKLGFSSEIIRKVAIAMYEGEINMVIHGDGGVAEVLITSEEIRIILTDHGPGIPDLELAMQEGYSTASENARELGFGAGMGLPNIKKYTDELVVESVVGKGTTVTMSVLIKK